jgi:hypothetical protein
VYPSANRTTDRRGLLAFCVDCAIYQRNGEATNSGPGLNARWCLTLVWRSYIAKRVQSKQRGVTKLRSPQAIGMARCPSTKNLPFPPLSGLGSGAGYSSHRRRRSRPVGHETASKKSLTTGRHGSRARLMLGEGRMSYNLRHPILQKIKGKRRGGPMHEPKNGTMLLFLGDEDG